MPAPPPTWCFWFADRCGSELASAVHHHQGVEVDFAAQRLDREFPVVVGHAHHVAGDRIGDSDRAIPDAGDAGLGDGRRGQIRDQGGGQGRIRGASQHFDRFNLARSGFQREARVGSADVRQQTRATRESGGQGGRRL
jgi:hypothetical protein